MTVWLGPRRRRDGGFALVLVVSVLAIVLVYLVTAQSAVLQSKLRERRTAALLDRAEAAAAVLAMAAQGGAAAQGPVRLEWNARTRLTFAARPLTDPSALPSALDKLGVRPGDVIVTIDWDAGDLPAARETYLINPLGARRGAVALADDIVSTASSPAAGAAR